MSTRQLRKLQQKNALAGALDPAKASAKEDSEDEVDEAPIQSKPRASLFSSLAALGNDEDGGDDQEEEESGDEAAEAVESAAPMPAAESKSSKAKKPKKKKKKGKKSEAPAKGKDVGDAPIEAVDEIDLALQQLAVGGGCKAGAGSNATGAGEPSDSGRSSAPDKRICALLRISTHHLRVLNEMRGAFGRDIMASVAEAEDEAAAGAAGGGGGRHRRMPRELDLEGYINAYWAVRGSRLPERILRRNCFIQGKETWPGTSAAGLTMKVETESGKVLPPGVVEFSFAHDKTYDEQEATFFRLVESYNPMNLVHYLVRNPYHISTLIQCSKIAHHDQNPVLAADLVERALFTFGRVTLSAFRKNLEEGKARLNFRRPENRQFWLAGYYYLLALMPKGTYRTALEWAKLLFSLDLEDPYAVMHWIHVLAIKAFEGQWFIDLCESGVLSQCKTPELYIRQTLVLAKLQVKDVAGAKESLIQGMESLPWLYGALFKALNLDVPKSIWGKVPRDADEEFYTALYVKLAKDIWNYPQATTLLKDAAAVANVRKNVDDLPRAPPVTLNVARLVYLEGAGTMRELLSLVPPALLQARPNFDFDPLPPPLDENQFSSAVDRIPWHTPDERDVWFRIHHPEAAADAQMVAALVAAARAGPGAARGPPGDEDDDFDGDSDDDEDDDFDGPRGADGDLDRDDDDESEEEENATGQPQARGGWLNLLNVLFSQRPAPPAREGDGADDDSHQDSGGPAGGGNAAAPDSRPDRG